MQITSTISDFNLKRNNILNKINYIKEILVKQGLDLGAIKDIEEKLINNNFSIIVVGEFSSGKSTFINALLRKKLLPAKVRPTTAIINIIEDGEPEATVLYKDKKVKKITIEEIQDFATALNENGEKEASKIDHMLIKYPCEYTKEGVKIIDTPGVEDLDKSREDITYQMIPNADASILLLDARRALKNSERIFLEEKILGNNINKLFFILNFADAIRDNNMEFSNENLKIIENKVIEDLKLITGKSDLKIHSISAKETLIENKKGIEGDFTYKFYDFEKELQKFLIEEKGNVLLNNSIMRLSLILDDSIKFINFKLSSFNKSKKELELRAKELENLIDKIRYDKAILIQDVNKAFNDLQTICSPEIDSILEKTISYIETIEIPKENKDIESFYISKFKEVLAKEIDLSVNKMLKDNIKIIITKIENRLLNLLNELDEFIVLDISNSSLDTTNVKINSKLCDKDVMHKQVAMGVGAYFAVPFVLSLINPAAIIAIPTLIIGYIFSGKAIMKWGSEHKKSTTIDKIRKSKKEIIIEINDEIKVILLKTSSEYCSAIERSVEMKIKDTSSSLSQIVEEKEKISKEEGSVLKSLSGLEIKINKIKNELNIMVKKEAY